MGQRRVAYAAEEQQRVDAIFKANYGLFVCIMKDIQKKTPVDEDMMSVLSMDFWDTCRVWNPKKGKLSTIARRQLRQRCWQYKQRKCAKLENKFVVSSLDAPLTENDCLYDYIGDPHCTQENVVDMAQMQCVKEAMRDMALTIRERKIVNLFLQGYTFSEIARLFDMKRQTVHNAYAKIVENLQYIIGKRA